MNNTPLICECGYQHQVDIAAQNLETVICPKCRRRISRGETWIHPIGDTNSKEMAEAGDNVEGFIKNRKMKYGY